MLVRISDLIAYRFDQGDFTTHSMHHVLPVRLSTITSHLRGRGQGLANVDHPGLKLLMALVLHDFHNQTARYTE